MQEERDVNCTELMLKALLNNHQRPRVIDLLNALDNNPELAADAAKKVRQGLVALRRSSTFVKFAISRYMRAVRIVQQLVRRLFARNIAVRQRALQEWARREQQLWAVAAVRRPPSEGVKQRVIREEFVDQRRRHAAVWRMWRKVQQSLQSQLHDVTTELHSVIERKAYSPVALKHLQDRMGFLNHRLQHHDSAEPRFHGMVVDLTALDARVTVVMRKEATERVEHAMETIGVHTEDAAFMETVVKRYEDVLEAEHARKRLLLQRSSMRKHSMLSFHRLPSDENGAGGRSRNVRGAAIAAQSRQKRHSVAAAQKLLVQPALQVLVLGGAANSAEISTSPLCETGRDDTTRLQRKDSSTMGRQRLIRFDSSSVIGQHVGGGEGSLLPSSTTEDSTIGADQKLEKTLRLSFLYRRESEGTECDGTSILAPAGHRKFVPTDATKETGNSSRSASGAPQGGQQESSGTNGTLDPALNSIIGSSCSKPSPPPKTIAARQCLLALGISNDDLAFPVEAPGTHKFSEYLNAARETSGFVGSTSAPLTPRMASPVATQAAASKKQSTKQLVVKMLPRCPPRPRSSDHDINFRAPRTNHSAQLRHDIPITARSRRCFTLGTGSQFGTLGGMFSEDEAAKSSPQEMRPQDVDGAGAQEDLKVDITRRASPPRKLKTDSNLEGSREVYRKRYMERHPPPRPPIELPPPVPLAEMRPPTPPFSIDDNFVEPTSQPAARKESILVNRVVVLPSGGEARDDGATSSPPPPVAAVTHGLMSIMTDGTLLVDGMAPKAYSAKYNIGGGNTISNGPRGSSSASAQSLMPVSALPTLSRVVNAVHVLDVAPVCTPESDINTASSCSVPMIAVACSDGSLRVYLLRDNDSCIFADSPQSRAAFLHIEQCGHSFLCVSCEDNAVYTYSFGFQEQQDVLQLSQTVSVASPHTASSSSPSKAAHRAGLAELASSGVSSRYASPQLARRPSRASGMGNKTQQQQQQQQHGLRWVAWGRLSQPSSITNMVAFDAAPSKGGSSVGGSSQQSLLAVSTYDHSILIWNVAEGRVFASLGDHTQGVHYMFMSRASGKLVSCSYDSTVRLWEYNGAADAEDSTSVASSLTKPFGGVCRRGIGLSAEPSVVPPDAFPSYAGSPLKQSANSPRRTAFLESTASISVADLLTPEQHVLLRSPSMVVVGDNRAGLGFSSSVFAQHSQAVLHAVDVSGRDRLIASISQEGSIRLWDQLTLESHCVISDVPGHLFVGCIAFPAAFLLAYVFADNTIRVFSSSSGKLQYESKLPQTPKAIAKLSHQGLMAVGSANGHVQVYAADSGSFVTSSSKLHSLSVTSITAVPLEMLDSATPSTQYLSLLVSGGEDRTVQLSRIPPLRQFPLLVGH